MSSLANELLRTGLDPNDSSWLTARYRIDWSNATFTGTLFDATRNVVELQPVSLVCNPDTWLPLGPVVDSTGTAYRADRLNHLLLSKSPCETEFRPVDCIGGHGWQTGQFNHPAGVTIDCRGWLLVADAGNHRVQVVKPEEPNVIAVLGRIDDWGQAISGSCDGAMVEPVHAVCDRRTFHIYVADRTGGLIHVFDDRFDYLRSFEPTTWPALGGPALTDVRMPIAIHVADDGSLWVLDANHPRVMRMTTDGAPLDDVGVAPGENPFAGGMALRPRYAASGEVIVGPYDTGDKIVGPLDSGVFDQSWHKIGVECRMPDGASIRVQTYVANHVDNDASTYPWAPIAPVAIERGETGAGVKKPERLVLSDLEQWKQHRHQAYKRAKPEVMQFSGDGPSSSNTFEIELETALQLRVGDTVELHTDTSGEELVLTSVSGAEYGCYALGPAKNYSTGTEVRLVERNGHSIIGGPRILHTLTGVEEINLSSAPMNDRLTNVNAPHSVGAFLRIGDRLELNDGADTAVLEVESIRPRQTVTVTTNVAVGGDYSNSSLRLINTPERLVCEDLEGFEYQPPRQTSIEIDDETGTHLAYLRFAESDVQTIWLEPGTTADLGTWSRFFTKKPVPTDRGRNLWVRLQFRGALRHQGDESAIASPTVHSVGALTPRPSLMKLLPAVFSRSEPDKDPVGALFLERYLALFEGQLTALESSYEEVSSLLNIETTDEEWLVYVSTWLGLILDPSWDQARRRQLLKEVMALYQVRGTQMGLARYLEIYTGNRPVILEGFRWRPASSMVIGRVGRLGCSALKSESCDYEPYAHRFNLHVFVDDAEELDVVESTVRKIIDSVKPAHTDYTLVMALPETRVGHQSRVGIDMVLSDYPVAPIRLPTTSDTDREDMRAIVGKNTLARNPTSSSKHGGPVIGAGGIRATGITLN